MLRPPEERRRLGADQIPFGGTLDPNGKLSWIGEGDHRSRE
jgi:hypothetical protein